MYQLQADALVTIDSTLSVMAAGVVALAPFENAVNERTGADENVRIRSPNRQRHWVVPSDTRFFYVCQVAISSVWGCSRSRQTRRAM